MRFVRAVLLLALTASPAFAQREPEIVVPGKPGVPVYINGIDASWGVVEGEFGLDRPGLMTPTVIYRPLVAALPAEAPRYRPTTGQRPGYGRLEIVPPANRPLPPPAPTFYRSWSSGSESGPVTDYPPYAMPNVEISPRFGRRNWHKPGNSPGGSGASGSSRSSANSNSSSKSGSSNASSASSGSSPSSGSGSSSGSSASSTSGSSGSSGSSNGSGSSQH